MLFKIQKETLLRGISHVAKALPSKSNIPAMLGIRFLIQEESIKLSATNSDLTIETILHSSTEEEDLNIVNTTNVPGFILPGKQLVELTKRLKDGWVEFHTTETQHILIKNGKSKMTLVGLNLVEFPQILEELKTPLHTFDLSKSLFLSVMKQTIPFVAISEQRPVLTGINMRIRDSKWLCTATDSLQLSHVEVDIESGATQAEITIPAKPLSEMIKTMTVEKGEESPMIGLTLYRNMLKLQDGSTVSCIRLLDNGFPDVTQLIPTEFAIELEFNRMELLQILERTVLLSDQIPTARLEIEADTKIATISSRQSVLGRSVELIESRNPAQHTIKVAFNPVYLKTALQTLSSDTVTVLLNGTLKPISIQANGNKKSTRLFMPVSEQ